MSRLFIYAYNVYSKSAKLLSEALDCYRIKHRNSRYVPRRNDVIINWGKAPYRHGVKVLNQPDACLRAINKHRAFVAMRDAGVSVPPFTTSKEEAARWLHEGRGTRQVVARTIVDGHEGAGIVITDNFLDIPDAPLYTLYIKKKHEFRVHVGRLPDNFYRIIDYVRKAKRRGFEGGRDTRIRNTANGYVFVRNDVNIPADAINQSIEAIKALGLDFGAVDVIYNEHQNRCYVLEVNTAPGIEGTTVTKYAEYFKEYLR